MDWTRRSLLLSTAAMAFAPSARGAAVGVGPKYFIVVLADGGWDVTFSVDPKPRSGVAEGPWVDESPNNPEDREEVRRFGDISVSCNDVKRPAVTDFFARFAPDLCVVNGIWMGSIVHQPCRIRMLTGSPHSLNPDVATIIGFEKGAANDRPLGSVDFSGLGYAGDLAATTGRIGHRSQLKTLLQEGVDFPAPKGADYSLPTFTPNPDEEAALRAHLEGRLAAYRAAYGVKSPRTEQLVDDALESYARRTRLLEEGESLAVPLTLGVQPSLLQQAEMAPQLLASGLCHSITLADVNSWDTHDRNATQHERYQSFFQAMGKLCESLKRAGIYDETMVLITSEMTRTPRRNAKTGKDHWAHTSALLLGPGVRGGAVVGATNESVESLPVDLESGDVSDSGQLNKYDNFAAGIAEFMGIDPLRWYPGVRPFRGFRA
jgi:hypothetical protein